MKLYLFEIKAFEWVQNNILRYNVVAENEDEAIEKFKVKMADDRDIALLKIKRTKIPRGGGYQNKITFLSTAHSIPSNYSGFLFITEKDVII
jgi:hypothetical protein